MARRHLTLLIPIAISCALLAACAHEIPRAVGVRQDIWHLREISSYDFVYYASGMAGNCELRVRVRNDRVVSARARRQCWLGSDDAPTIDGVFATLRNEYRHSDKVTAVYDTRYGFPTAVSVDRDRNAIDDEWSFGIRNFVPR